MNTKENPPTKGVQRTGISETRNIYTIVQSFCLKTFSVGVNYLAGLLNVSPCWLVGILVVFIYRDHRRLLNKFNQHVAMAFSLRNEGQMLVLSVNQPPLCVQSPEIENCEWLNKILCSIWPNITKYIEKVAKNTIEPRINEAMSAYKNNPNFSFHIISLGSIVPRICGMKVYKNHSRQFEHIILDIRLFYAGDIEIYFYLMSLGGGVQNLEITGWLRIVFKTVVQQYPLSGGIEIFFLHKPKINYDFKGAMDILKTPGISGMLRRTIEDQVSLHMVLPNKITIKMSEVVDSGYWKCPDPEGLIRIHVIEAKDLRDDGSSYFGPGTSDPYVVVTFGFQTAFSEPYENSLNPEWNLWANFMTDYSSFDECVVIDVNERNGNQTLGTVSIELSLAKEKKFIPSWVQLEDTSSGMIHLEIYYYNLTYNIHDVGSIKLPYVLVVFINTAFNLVNPRINKPPNSVVCLEIGKDTKVSKSALSNNPVFEEAFLFVINDDPKSSKLKLKLVDTNSKTDLGNATLLLKRVFEANFMEVIDQNCPLIGTTKESSISLSMRLRLLKH